MIAHIFVSGRVQGVGFRAFCVEKAILCGVSGWVRNRMNGQVEIYADADEAQLAVFLKFVKEGPLWSAVRAIEPVRVPDAPLYPVKQGVFEQIGTL